MFVCLVLVLLFVAFPGCFCCLLSVIVFCLLNVLVCYDVAVVNI